MPAERTGASTDMEHVLSRDQICSGCDTVPQSPNPRNPNVDTVAWEQGHIVRRHEAGAGEENASGRNGVVASQEVDELLGRAPHVLRRGLAGVDLAAVSVDDPKLDRERRREVVGDQDRGPNRARAGKQLGLWQVERVLALDVPRGQVVANRDTKNGAVVAENESELGFRDGPARVGADTDRRAWPDRAPPGRVLEEDLRPLGDVDEAVDVLHVRLLDPRPAAPFIRHARRPRLSRDDGYKELPRVGELERLGVVRLDRPARSRGALGETAEAQDVERVGGRE